MDEGWRTESLGAPSRGWTPAARDGGPRAAATDPGPTTDTGPTSVPGPGADLGPAVLAEVPDLAPLVRAALAKRVPPAMRGGRLKLSWAAVAALAVLVAIAVAAGAVFVLRGRSHVVAADQPIPTSKDFTPASAAPSLTASGTVTVEVAGKVRHQGAFTLPAGSRVIDALKAAGGAQPGVDTTSVGLARKLTDGEQVRIGLSGPGPAAAPGATGSDASAGGLLDLNAATEAQFDALPGVGPVIAGRIVAWRTEHGGFTSVGQLKQVQGLTGKKGDDLVDLVTVG